MNNQMYSAINDRYAKCRLDELCVVVRYVKYLP
jgi:hypothetical protein